MRYWVYPDSNCSQVLISPVRKSAYWIGIALVVFSIAFFPLYFAVSVIRLTEATIYALRHLDQPRITLAYPNAVESARVNRPTPPPTARTP